MSKIKNKNIKKENFTTEISTVLAAELPSLEKQNLDELDGSTAVRKYRATVNTYYNSIDELRIKKKKEMEALFKIKWDEMTKDHSKMIKAHLDECDKELKKRVYIEKMLELKNFHEETFKAIQEIINDYTLDKGEIILLYNQFMLEDTIDNHSRITSNIKVDIEDFVTNVLLIPEEVDEEVKEVGKEVEQVEPKQESDVHDFTITFTNTSVSKIISILRKEGQKNWRYQKTTKTK